MENLPPVLPAAKVALLIDADNIGDVHADGLFRKAASYGNVIVRRAYGVMGNFPWSKEILHRYAITPVARPVYVSGKNITDMTLIIDAMDLVYQKTANVMCIASNDSDFSPLAMKLREYGIAVYGFGNEQAQKSFIASCDGFNYLAPEPEKAGAKDSDSEPVKKTAKQPDNDLVKNLKDACLHYGDNDGWTLMNEAVTYLRRIEPEFSPQKYGHTKFKKLLESMDVFEIDENKNAPTHPKIRIKDGGKKKK